MKALKSTTLWVTLFLLSVTTHAQVIDSAGSALDSIEKSFVYQHGKIELRNGIGFIEVPAGYKYLDIAQSEYVLTELWGNPKGTDLTLGMLFPESSGVMDAESYVFNIQYDELGFVKDEDADEMDYEELLGEMKKDAEEANPERTQSGYDPISIVGWAAKPFYDKDKKVLHWAKEIKFGSSESNTLNYNIRILGRKGVLILNAISDISVLPEVNKTIPQVLGSVGFADGYKYSDFDPDVDEVAAWTIGGLVAGKVLAKVGFFAIILKFWKLIAIAVVGVASAFWKKIFGKKEEEPSAPEQIAENPQQEENTEAQ